ncbi:Transcriptional adapter ADA2a, partial [Mucuna pruriens]
MTLLILFRNISAMKNRRRQKSIIKQCLGSACGKAYSSTIKKASNVSQNNDGVKVEEQILTYNQLPSCLREKKLTPKYHFVQVPAFQLSWLVAIQDDQTQAGRSIGEKKPKLSGEDRPSMTELSGYSFKREEFDIEYDNDAEQVLADMEFKDTDTEAEQEMKLHVLHIYSKRYEHLMFLSKRESFSFFIIKENQINC